MLKADGVNPSSVHYVVIPFPNMIAALKAHRVGRDQRRASRSSPARRPRGAKKVLS